jgi:hypothetical protein
MHLVNFPKTIARKSSSKAHLRASAPSRAQIFDAAVHLVLEEMGMK